MKITGVRTIHFAPFANITFLELTTDSGIVGLGETYYTPRSVTAYIGEVLTPLLLESDPLQIEAFWRRAYENSHIYGNKGAGDALPLGGGCSALGIFWDRSWAGRSGSFSAGRAIRTACRSTTPAPPQDTGRNHRDISRKVNTAASGTYQDFEAWQPGGDAGALARSLLDMGIRAMKIWPFDRFALANHGQTISFAEIEEGLQPWRQVRDAVGLEMDIILEGHGYWALQPARRIAEALEPYKPVLLEDLMKA